jgi:hypothetical protein
LSEERKHEIEVGNASSFPTRLVAGDFNGDSVLDAVTTAEASGILVYLPSRYIVPHINCRVDPRTQAGTCSLVDPRNPASYRIEIPEATIRPPTQVALLPTTVFELPWSARKAAFERSAFLNVVTNPVSVLLDRELDGRARLTLRLRSQDPEALRIVEDGLESLHIFRSDGASVNEVQVDEKPEIVAFGEGRVQARGISFTILQSGSYLVALEQRR